MTGSLSWVFPLGSWVLLALAGCSCGDDASEQSADADAGTDWPDAEPSDADHDRFDAGEADAADGSDAHPDSECPPKPIPEGVPEGWVEYPVFDCGYRFYVPSTEAYLPPPLAWEECTDDGGEPYECRQLRMEEGELVGGHSNGYVESDGRVVLQFRRITTEVGSPGKMDYRGLVVEADGPVRQAILAKGLPLDSAYWAPGEFGIAPGKVLWKLVKWNTSPKSIERLAVIGGSDRDLAPAWMYDRPDEPGNWTHARTGPNEWIEVLGPEALLHGWDGTEYGVIWKSNEDYGTAWSTSSYPVWDGSTVFWDAISISYSWIWSWTKEAGSRRLISYGPDTSRAAASFGADDEDMVWVEGKDRPPTGSTYPTQSIMTAPLTAEPEEVQPRRLRSWQGVTVWSGHPAVGCGYAAFFHGIADVTEQLLILRLSDGVSWILRNPDGRPWAWGYPLAVTCDEVFVRTSSATPEKQTIRRIRLDSLGPGLPPD